MLDLTNDNLHEADGNENVSAVNQDSAFEKAQANESKLESDNKHLDAIEARNAEESEDETLKSRDEIPMEEYDKMNMESLIEAFEKLMKVDKIMIIKDHVEEIKNEFLSQFHIFIDDKKEEFENENPDSIEDFQYHFPLKTKFDALYTEFKNRRNAHYNGLQKNLKSNLENRLAIVEELKELINPNENIKDTLKHFNELRERWKNAGPIPRDKYNHVWNNYHFHVENFYDYLHLDREARDLDFKHNLEQKNKIIARVQELTQMDDLNKAFRELQDLHKIWKEDIGPVAKEHRDEIWNQFSDLTKQMHDKRERYFEIIREREKQNLTIKNEIIAQIKAISNEPVSAHSQWHGLIQKVETLRDAFFKAGKVPNDVNEETWATFKNAVRDFNVHKNNFYKEIKKDQNENLNKKLALLEKANQWKNAEDFASTTPLMKQIQEEWKTIGHVPRKYSDKIWKDFKDACNHYFDRLKSQKNEANADEIEAFEKKKALIENLRQIELTGVHKTDLETIKSQIEQWKSIGKVPFSRRHIEGKFNKILDILFEKLSGSKKESEMMRFNSKIEQLSESEDPRRLENEKIFIQRRIEEVQSEIFQLENNIQFFSNAKKDNPLVKEVYKNIERHKEELTTWKEKLNQIKNLNN